MKPFYSKVIFEDLKNSFKDYNGEVSFWLINDEYDAEHFKSGLQQGLTTVVLDARKFEYIKDRIVPSYTISDSDGNYGSYNFDYINTVPMELIYNVHIHTKDIEQLSEFEEFIQSSYAAAHKLSIEHPLLKEKEICFDFSLDKTHDIFRNQLTVASGDRPTYHSAISMIGLNCVSCTETYSAAQLELDKNAKLLIIKRLAAYEDIKALIIEQDSVNNAKIEAIDTVWKALDETIDSLQGITTYHHLYEVMKNNDCNEQKALEIIRKEQEQEARREAERKKRLEEQEKKKQEAIRYAEKMYTKKGDDVLNRYTDTIVEDIKRRLSVDFPVFVYGGSSFYECLKADKIGELQYPCILVWDNMNFTFEIKNYQNVYGNGETIIHSFEKDILPINYGINIRIFAEEKQQVSLLKKQICALYEQEVEMDVDEKSRLKEVGIKSAKSIKSEMTINIPDPKLPEEFYPLKLGLDLGKNYNFEQENDDWVYFRKYPCVYHVKTYDEDYVCDNQRLQLRMMQQAQFLLQCSSLVGSAVSKFNKDFVNLTTKQTSVMGSLFKSLLHSKEYKMLKECFEYGRPIDRNLFETVFSDTVKVFPSLYDKFIQGWTYEQMSSEMQGYDDYFTERYNLLCDQLDIPEEKYPWRSNDALAFYINEMAKSADCTVSQAIEVYKVELQRRQEEAQRRQEELRRRNEEYLEQKAQEWEERREQGSSGGGFLSSVLGTAGGVALGNKMSNGKKDLFGTSVCIRCKKNRYGSYPSSCFHCPAERRCTQKTR